MIFENLKKNFISEPTANENIQIIVEMCVPKNKISQILGHNRWIISRLELTTGSKIVPFHSGKNSVDGTSPLFIIGDFENTQVV